VAVLGEILVVACFVAGSLWLLMPLLCLWGQREFRELRALEPEDDLSSVLVSAIVPVRNEASRIEEAVRRLLDQRGAGLRVEVIVVDDRSSDGTGEILDRLQQEHEELTVLHVEELPPGWLGKCHACHLGEGQAKGDWLLFMDADSHLGPDVVARAVQVARQQEASHFCLAPGFRDCTLAAKVTLVLASLPLVHAALGMNRDWRFVAFGIGAFNMVRRTALEQLGGYQALRMEVVDDVGLGAGIKRLGGRSRIYTAFQDLEVHWGHTVANFVHVIEKNHFAVLGYRTALALTAPSFLLLIWIVAVLGPFVVGSFSGSFAGWYAGVGLFSLAVPSALLARRHGWSAWIALLVPLFVPVVLWAMANSAFTTLRQGGVRWRDTFYPLTALRAARRAIGS
jgi:glycosyltransferase involved in cell wall biosynthesis